MKNLFDKACLASRIAAASIFIITVMAAPHALAQDAAAQRIKQLEQSLQAIQMELQKMKSENAQAAQKVNSIEQTTNQTVQKVNNIEQTRSSSEARIATPGWDGVERKNHMLHFRGGFTHAMQNRNGSSIRSNVAPVGAQDQADKDGWYVGAGLDWKLTDNVWGALPKTSVFAELMFEYKQFGNNVQGNALANMPTMLAGGALNPRSVTVSQFTLTASPKIKFFEGSKLRPWIIPMGLALHVISPTSESITYLTPGVQFGAGVDYNIWKDFFVGIDGRYQLTAGKSDGVKVDGMTAGGYIGVAF